MKKSHLIFASFLALVLIGLQFLPDLIKRLEAEESFQRFTVDDVQIYNLDRSGVIEVTSGIVSVVDDRPLFTFHELWLDLPVSDSDTIMTRTNITTTTLMSAATHFINSGNFTQPPHPRTVEVNLKFASGTVVIVGSNTFGQSIRELVRVTSGTAARSNHPFIFISSVSVYITSVSAFEENVRFDLGASTGIGLMHDIKNSTDVYRISENNVVRTTFGVSAVYDTFQTTSIGGGNDYNLWYRVRRTLMPR